MGVLSPRYNGCGGAVTCTPKPTPTSLLGAKFKWADGADEDVRAPKFEPGWWKATRARAGRKRKRYAWSPRRYPTCPPSGARTSSSAVPLQAVRRYSNA
jgi:hypothetical protein